MESTPIYAQKVTILSRLIKESSLTLEEALLLLKEEEPEEGPVYTPSTTTPWTVTNPYIYPNIGTITVSSGSSSILSTYNSPISNQTGTDLNN
jgi:hypothetical protein